MAEARRHLETPWRHQARGPRALDCAGLVIRVGRDLGLTDYDTTAYPRATNSFAFMDHFSANLERIPVPRACPGDVLVLRDETYPCHCGIMAERGAVETLIHAHAGRRKVMEEPLDQGPWRALISAAFRYPGVED